LIALLNDLSSDRSSSLKKHFMMISYSKILKFTVAGTNNEINFKVLFGTNLTFSSQEMLEFRNDFDELCKNFFKESGNILISTDIIRYDA